MGFGPELRGINRWGKLAATFAATSVHLLPLLLPVDEVAIYATLYHTVRLSEKEILVDIGLQSVFGRTMSQLVGVDKTAHTKMAFKRSSVRSRSALLKTLTGQYAA
jgi:hypothetical protein